MILPSWAGIPRRVQIAAMILPSWAGIPRRVQITADDTAVMGRNTKEGADHSL